MLKKIIGIKNTGQLRNCFSRSDANSDAQLQESTVIFGTNGDGKSTFCAVLRSLSENDPGYVLGRKTLGQENEPTIEIRCEGDTARFDNGAWTGARPKIAVYDDTFIEQNIFAGNIVDIEQRRGLYRVIIGKKGVEIAEREAALTQAVRELTADCKSKEELIATRLPQGTEVETFLRLIKNENIEQEIQDQERALESVNQAAMVLAHVGFSNIEIPSMSGDLAEILGKTLADMESDAETKIAAHIARHEMGEAGNSWLEEGADYILGGQCPFCTQDIRGNDQVAAYKTVFSEEYKSLKSEISSLRSAVEELFGPGAVAAVNLDIERNNTAKEFWHSFVDLDADSLIAPDGITRALEQVRNLAIVALNAKLAAPLEEITISDDLEEALRVLNDDVRGPVADYNKAIDVVCGLVSAAKEGVGDSDAGAETAKLNTLKAIKLRHEPDMRGKCDELIRLRSDLKIKTVSKDSVRAELETYTREVMPSFEERVNELLDDFNATFRLVQTSHGFPGGQPSTNYQIAINGENVALGNARSPKEEASFKNTLSAGDKSSLALAFFLVGLENDPDKAELVVVFDDPFTSQDRFRRANTIYEIRRVGREVAQVIILSHDEGFLKTYWEKCDTNGRKSLKFHNQGEAAGSILMACDIEELCRARIETERQKLLAFYHEKVGDPYDIVQKMRVVLETHFKTTYPASFTDETWLGEICGKILGDGAAGPAWYHYERVDRINGYTSRYHHGDDQTQIDRSVPIDPQELKGFVKWTLKILNVL